MKKKIGILLGILVLVIVTFIIVQSVFNRKKFYDPEYNSEYITNIKNIGISNKEIKNQYQFVYISDLHASIDDENEIDENIKKSLVERNELFVNQHIHKIQSDKIFNEIIQYTNNKNADALLLAGDIIDSPSDSNINFLRENIKNLKTDYLYTLGNHDWSFAWEYHTQKTQETFYPKFLEFMDDVNVSYLEYEDLIVLTINDSKNQIEEDSVKKIEQVLEKNKPTLVMLHVPIATKYIADEAMRIRNRVSAIGEDGVKPTETTQKAIDLILSEKYNVFGIISGHVHFDIEDNLTENILECVSAPAYGGNINVIKINN